MEHHSSLLLPADRPPPRPPPAQNSRRVDRLNLSQLPPQFQSRRRLDSRQLPVFRDALGLSAALTALVPPCTANSTPSLSVPRRPALRTLLSPPAFNTFPALSLLPLLHLPAPSPCPSLLPPPLFPSPTHPPLRLRSRPVSPTFPPHSATCLLLLLPSLLLCA